MISKKINGIKYVIKNRNDIIQNNIITNKQWNEGIYNFIIDIIQKKNLKHFLNVGCHIGTIALPVSKFINKVSCIEAYQPTYNHLIENIQLNKIKNIHALNIAVGNSEEDIYLMG